MWYLLYRSSSQGKIIRKICFASQMLQPEICYYVPLKGFSSLSFPFLHKYSSSHNRNCRKGYNEISFPFLPACFGWLGETKVLEYDYPYLRGKNDIICHLTSSQHSGWCALSQCRENSRLTANRYLCPQLFRHFCLL